MTYFTDPLCCWSWALEEACDQLRRAYGQHLAWRCCMAGLIKDWDSYQDPLNSVSRPAQMGPYWMHVRKASGVAIDETIWREDPPASSYPGCLAVKAAEMQSAAAGELYLRRAREAVMLERRNVARREVLLELAGELAREAPTRFDLARFRDDLASAPALEALRADLRETRDKRIGRFPALAFRRGPGNGFVVIGYRPFDNLEAALLQIAPELRGPAEHRTSTEDAEGAGGAPVDRELPREAADR